MKKVLLAAGVMTVFLAGCWDRVDLEFEKLKSDLCVADKQPIMGDKDWYQVYRVSEQEIEKIMKTDFSRYGYGSWKPFRHNGSFGVHKIYRLSKYSASNEWDVIVLKKIKGREGRGGEIAVYIDKRKGELLLHFGITDQDDVEMFAIEFGRFGLSALAKFDADCHENMGEPFLEFRK